MSSNGGEYGVTCIGRSIAISGGVMVTNVLDSRFNKFHPVVGHFRRAVAVSK
jgi:hypothetical protein